MELKDNVVSFRKGESGRGDGAGGRGGDGDHGERLARLEVHVQHLKENSATKEDIATVNGKLDTMSQALKNLVTKDDLQADRRRLTSTIIAVATLLFVGLGVMVAWLGNADTVGLQDAQPSPSPAPRSEQAVSPPATLGSSTSARSKLRPGIEPVPWPS